jgi:hypothetical protein
VAAAGPMSPIAPTTLIRWSMSLLSNSSV